MRTHALNISYLVIGLIFLGLSGSWLLKETGVVDLGEVRWLFPMTLVLAGAIGLVAVAAKGLSREKRGGSTEEQAAYQPDTYTYDNSYATDTTVDTTVDTEEKDR
jgi:hypothetical protein